MPATLIHTYSAVGPLCEGPSEGRSLRHTAQHVGFPQAQFVVGGAARCQAQGLAHVSPVPTQKEEVRTRSTVPRSPSIAGSPLIHSLAPTVISAASQYVLTKEPEF